MQAILRWSPPTGTLGELVAAAERRAAAAARSEREIIAAAEEAPLPPSFAAALRGGTVGVIAELKRSSPSKGAIAPALDAASQASAYARGGASAISVLTEPERFGGSSDDLRDARGCGLPLLRKDFIVHPVQIAEARAWGASAVLLIARALAPDALDALAADARSFGLDVLVEIRDAAELERALRTDAALVGVNNRNLETLVIDPETAVRLVPLIPSDRLGVAESGMLSRADVERAATFGADAVLVGSSVSAAPDPAAAVRALTGVPRVARDG